MCGIAGIKRYGEELISPAQVTTLLLECQSRGTDAAGVALQRADGEFFVLKSPDPAWKFIQSGDYKRWMTKYLDEKIICAIVHARAATLGSPQEETNNHPLWKKDGNVCAVHNGHIGNHDVLFRDLNLDRAAAKCEVDSDIIRAILDKEGLSPEGIRKLKLMRGSAAIAAFSNAEPGKLLLARSGSPIMMASTEEMLVWASEKRFIHTAMRRFVRRFGFIQQANRSDMTFSTMPDNSAWILGAELQDDLRHPGERTALLFHEEFETTKWYTPPIYRPHDTFPQKRRQFWKDELPEATVCPNPECGIPLTIPLAQRRLPLWRLICTKCGHDLADTPKTLTV